jgi:hypothetical protein
METLILVIAAVLCVMAILKNLSRNKEPFD